MIEKVSYHTHSKISDGKLGPEELVNVAIEKGFKVLAITDHYTRPRGLRTGDIWGVDFYSDKDHQELVKLKEKYADQIKILVGVEFDWFPTKKKWISEEVKRREYDLKIVSVHLVLIKGEYYHFNSKEEDFLEILGLLGNDIKKFVRLYYKSIREAIKTGLFDVVGHFDLIKAFNKDARYFSEQEEWYNQEVVKTLKLMKKYNVKLDLNLQGFIYKCNEQFPSKWIIDIANKIGIGILVGTDAHDEKGLDYDMESVRKLMG